MAEPDADIIQEAKDRFHRCETFEASPRKLFVEDIKFANADADNGWQWPNDIRRDRELQKRPNLTINKTRQHNLQIINDAKQNKASIRIRPTGEGATKEAADVFEGIVRHIEYQSNAIVAYDTGTKFQVEGGIGWWRVLTDYAGNDTFDQEIYIRRIKNPLAVYMDPDINEKDGSDARFAFVFDDKPKDEAELEWPWLEGKFPQNPLGGMSAWISKDHVRVAEYYRRSEVKDQLLLIQNKETQEQTYAKRSDIPRALRDLLAEDETVIVKKREITSQQVEWFKIVGDEIVDRKVGKDCWPGTTIPLVRVIGEETLIDGKLDRKGHTRALKDPQRMYNYQASANIEYGALQTKAPWVGAAEAIEGYETYWQTANTVPHSILPYNAYTDAGQKEIPAPTRSSPPQEAAAFITGMKIAAEDMMMVSGQYQADFGAPSNEKSGKAIEERQRQGDNATYHYIDNLAVAIRYTGKILIEVIPKVYDTPRVIKIMAEDGTDSSIQLDPQAKQAYQEAQKQQQSKVAGIFNPTVGKYEVEADIGPAYATRRQEAWTAFVQISAQNKELMPIIGDLMFKNADFPGAEDIAERLKRMVPPQALGEDGASPAAMQAQHQIQTMQKAMEQLVNQLAEQRLKLAGKDAKMDVDKYNAITERLEMLLDRIPSEKDIAGMVHDLVVQEHQNSQDMLGNEHQAGLDMMQTDQAHGNALEMQDNAPAPAGAGQ